MPPLAVEDRFDWASFATRYWDRAPVLFKAVAQAPFDETEVLRAAVRAAGSASAAGNVQAVVERTQLADPGALAPADALVGASFDASFDAYEARVRDVLGGQRYALIINAFHAFDPDLWMRERAFLAGLWRQVGQPLTSAITTMFHGTYEHSPVGVHKDRFATFMFGLRGRKRMRFWPRRPWSQPVSTILDYRAYLADSFVADVAPGDLLYWPSSYYHVGENAGTEPATSVNIGVPRDEHRAAYDLQRLLVGVDAASLVDDTMLVGRLPAVTAALHSPGADATGRLTATPAPALAEAAETWRALAADLAGLTTTASLRVSTAAGLEPVPPPAPRRALRDTDVVQVDPAFPPRWADRGAAGRVCAANGHTVDTSAAPDALCRLLAALRPGEPVPVRDLLVDGADPEELRRVLEYLESFRGITRIDPTA